MASATYNLLVDWNNDGDYDDTHDDITSDVISMRWKRGRDYASQLTGNSSAGKLEAVLINTDGKYSPSNSSSALSGNILPARKIKLEAGTGSFPYTFPFTFNQTMFTGFLDRIVPSPSTSQLKTCTLTAVGALGYLNDFAPSLTTQTDIRSDQAIGAILDDVGWSTDDRDFATGQTTLKRFWVDGKKTIESMRIVEEAEDGFIKETKDGKIGFESRLTRLQAPYITSQATFSDASGASLGYITITQKDPLDTIANHLEATSRSYAEASVAVLWTHPETGADSPTLTPSQSKTFEAMYPNSSAANNAAEVGTWTTPASTTDYIANTASDGSGTNRTSSITVTQTKTAERMIMTFTNGHATDTVYLTKIQARGTAITASNDVTVRSIDTDSQSIYGERKYKARTQFLPSSSEAQDWCDYQLSVYSSPIEVLSMTYIANISDAMLTEALSRDISDRVTIVATNDANLGINADFFIESESHRVTADGTHTVTWALSPASGGYSRFWVLGTGILGTSTVPAY
jgi:hypothetical protein